MGLSSVFSAIRTVHSYWLWLIGAILFVFLLRFLMRIILKDPCRPQDVLLSYCTIFALDIQLLMGIALWINYKYNLHGSNPARLYEHPTMMVIAIALAHIGHKLQKRPASQAERARQSKSAYERRATKGMFFLVAAFVCIALGATRILMAG